MQQPNNKIKELKCVIGNIIREIRIANTKKSINEFAREYDLDRGNLSKIEKGEVCCSLITAWRIAEGAGIKFSDFAKMLEDNLGEDFKLMDE